MVIAKICLGALVAFTCSADNSFSAVDCWNEGFRRDFCCLDGVDVSGCFGGAYTREACCHPSDPAGYNANVLRRILSWWSDALGISVDVIDNVIDSSQRGLNESEVVDLIIEHISDDNKYIFNVGGACYSPDLGACLWLDPALKLMASKKWRGVIVDPTPHAALMSWAQAHDAQFRNLALTPENAPRLMREWEVPRNFAFLKIDIDSDDCDLLEVILAHYSPMVITLEVHEEFPPPIEWSMSVRGTQRPQLYPALPVGCSAAYAHRLLAPSYRLLQYDMVHTSHDCTWIRRDLGPWEGIGKEPSIMEAYVAGWIQHQRSKTHTAEPRPFPEGAWRAGVGYMDLFQATRSLGQLRGLVNRMKHGIRRSIHGSGWSHIVNFTLTVPV